MQGGSRNNPKDNVNDWLDDGEVLQPECSKNSPKSPKSSLLEKTQRIKKPKKQDAKLNIREETRPAPVNQSIEDMLVGEAVQRLRTSHSKEGDSIPIYKKLTRQRLLEFLEMIEFEYSHVVSLYLAERRAKESCGSLKGLFLRFIDSIIAAFPVLNNIVFEYAFQYYASGPLQSRFNRLMDKNITPILKLMSEKFSKTQPPKHQKHDLEASTHFSHSPQRQQLEQFETQDAKKIQKKKRKKNKKAQCEEVAEVVKKQEALVKVGKQQVDKGMLQLTNYLQNLCIDKESRVECRIDEQQITRWKFLGLKMRSNNAS